MEQMNIKREAMPQRHDRKHVQRNTTRASRGRDQRWSVRRYRLGSAGGLAYVEFMFPSEGGTRSRVCVAHSELRHKNKLLDEVANYLPVYPAHVGDFDGDQIAFLRDLIKSRAKIEIVPSRTGFLDRHTFVTCSEMVHSDGSRVPRPTVDNPDILASRDVKGTLEGSKTEVLELARNSTCLGFAMGVALAAPLPTYLRLCGEATGESAEILLPETAVFNFSGPSSSGKSSACLAAVSLAGSPERAGSFDFSRRGLAEMANDSNDLVVVTDDTEKGEDGPGALVKPLKSIVHMVPGGRSKTISKGVDPIRFPELRWSTLGLCSSPKPISDLARGAGWVMSAGDKVRLFDIRVPGPKKGGIFDRLPGSPLDRAKNSIKMIRKLQRGYSTHCGHVIPEWTVYLMRKDRSRRIVELANWFIDHVGARRDGWEVRFARKFGVVFAAMTLGVRSRLLPWPENLPLKIAMKCYRRAHRAARPDNDTAGDTLSTLDRLIAKPGRIVEKSSGTTHLSYQTIAIWFRSKGRVKLGLLDDALVRALGSGAAKKVLTAALTKARLVPPGRGHGGTVQERIKIERDGKITERPRLWVFDLKNFRRAVRRAR